MSSTSSVASFGEWLREKRRGLKLTQEDLADRVACSAITIRKIEAGERLPSEQVAQLLAQVLDIAPDRHDHFIMFARGELDAEAAQEALRYSRAASNHHLPAPLTPLIGREQELQTLSDLLLKGRERLITLAGPPGIGKTRLGIEVAWAVAGKFADGAVFVTLAPVRDPDLVITTIAGALEVQDSGDQPLLTRLIRYLLGKRMLLLLDNLEHVLDAGWQVARLLEGCPDLKVLVTSREPLHMRGEQRFFVAPLPLPDPAHLSNLQILSANPAIELFVQRARANQFNFRLNNENAHALAAICIQLDGLPLAIELAAARIGILSAANIHERLGSRLGLLTTGSKDLPPHQRTLRTAIEWSYNLLSEDEQKLFARLGVFVGGCTLPAAEAICNAQGDLQMDLMDALASLIHKSLLKQDDGAHGPRFAMLETIREYASERLELSKEAETIQRLHAEYYLAFADVGAQGLQSAEQPVWLDRLEQEHNNFRAVLGWAERARSEDGEHGWKRIEAGLRLVDTLRDFWIMRGYVSEGRDHARAILAVEAVSRGAIAPPDNSLQLLRAHALSTAGELAWLQGDYNAAQAYFEDVLGAAKELGDKGVTIMADALGNLGIVLSRQGDHSQAAGYHSQALDLYHSMDNKLRIADALHDTGVAMQRAGDYGRGAELLRQALAIRLELGDAGAAAHSRVHLGFGDYKQGNHASARACFTEALPVVRELGDKFVISECLEGLAYVATVGEDAERAAWLFGAAAALRQEAGISVYPHDADSHRAAMTEARARLDDGAWHKAWTRGQDMSMDQAIDYAVES